MKDWEDVSENVNFPKGVRHGSAFKVSKEVFDKLIHLP
jgi:beta-galactosidase